MPAIRLTSSGSAPSPPKNNNPKGKNQHKDCPPPDDPRILELLTAYHRQNITDRKRLSKLLREDHGIIMSESTIARRKRELGLHASGRTTLELADSVKRQLVKDQMDKDQTGRIGAKTVKTRIFEETGIDLTRDWIRNEMRLLAPVEFASRRPRHKAPKDPDVQVPITTVVQTQHASQPDSPDRLGPHPLFNVPPVRGDSFDNSDPEIDPLPPLFQPSTNHTPEPYHPAPLLLPSAIEPLALPLPISSSNSAPGPSVPAILDILSREVPKMTTLTRLLGAVDFDQLRESGHVPSTVYDDVIKYMEAAALLERQLSRFASGLTIDRRL